MEKLNFATKKGGYAKNVSNSNAILNEKIIQLINSKPSFKVTLGGCIIKKVNGTIILSKE